jgi:hypothetical protein
MPTSDEVPLVHQRDDGRRVLAVFNLAGRHLIMDDSRMRSPSSTTHPTTTSCSVPSPVTEQQVVAGRLFDEQLAIVLLDVNCSEAAAGSVHRTKLGSVC